MQDYRILRDAIGGEVFHDFRAEATFREFSEGELLDHRRVFDQSMWITKLVPPFYHGHLMKRPVFGSRQWTMLCTLNEVVLAIAGVSDVGVKGAFDVRESLVRALSLGFKRRDLLSGVLEGVIQRDDALV